MTAALNRGELFASFDIDAFEVPHGRDELWRFTPLRRLRGLHDGSAPATGRAEIDVGEQPGVRVEAVRRGDERLGQGGEWPREFRGGVESAQRGCAREETSAREWVRKIVFNSRIDELIFL